MVSKVHDASVDLGGTLQAVVESLNCLFDDVPDNAKAKMGQAKKQILSSLDAE